jgi:hypothetical protein
MTILLVVGGAAMKFKAKVPPTWHLGIVGVETGECDADVMALSFSPDLGYAPRHSPLTPLIIQPHIRRCISLHPT